MLTKWIENQVDKPHFDLVPPLSSSSNMASNVLPQAFLLLSPANYSTQFPQLKSQFGVPIDSFRSLSLSNSRVSNLSSFSPVSSRRKSRNLIVRSETESGESGAVVVEELPEEVEVSVAVKQSRVKLGDVMGILNKKAVKAAEEQRAVPDIRTGDVVQIRLEVPENKRRLSVYKGIVISRQNAGIHTTIRVRRIIAGVGVEIVFPLYSPNIKEIKVVTHRKVRKARLYYLRDKLPRLSTFK